MTSNGIGGGGGGSSVSNMSINKEFINMGMYNNDRRSTKYK